MDITEVRIKLMEESSERLRAFCSITLDDCFVVRDLKIIEGSGGPFVAMPSRKLTFHCPDCGSKNHLRAGYCNQCGRSLKSQQPHEDEGRIKLYADIAHPINSQCRELIQDKVLAAYDRELEESKRPDYVSKYDDYGEEWEYGPTYEEELEVSTGAQRKERAAAVVAGEKAGSPTEPEQPRGPHKKPQEQKAQTPWRRSPPDDFGAGIF